MIGNLMEIMAGRRGRLDVQKIIRETLKVKAEAKTGSIRDFIAGFQGVAYPPPTVDDLWNIIKTMPPMVFYEEMPGGNRARAQAHNPHMDGDQVVFEVVGAAPDFLINDENFRKIQIGLYATALSFFLRQHWPQHLDDTGYDDDIIPNDKTSLN